MNERVHLMERDLYAADETIRVTVWHQVQTPTGILVNNQTMLVIVSALSSANESS